MNVGSTKELSPEKRISITPETSKSFKNLGLKVILEKGFGESLGFSDKDYADNGVEILSNSSEVLSKLIDRNPLAIFAILRRIIFHQVR